MTFNVIRYNLNTTLDITTTEIARIKRLLKIYPGHSQLKGDLKRLERMASHIRGAIEFLPSEPSTLPSIADVLKRFGVTLSAAGRLISPKGKETAVTIAQNGEIVSYKDTKGVLLDSHMYSPHLVERFINNNWNWKKTV